jgi:hypothetical protein
VDDGGGSEDFEEKPDTLEGYDGGHTQVNITETRSPGRNV